MATPKHYYDTSKYISLPVAIVGSMAVLIILILVGMKYSAFDTVLLSAKAAPSPGLAKCIKEHNECIADAQKAYTKCTNDAQKEMVKCLNKITETDRELREAERADCEVKAAQDVSNCTVDLSTDIASCSSVMLDCLKEYYEEKDSTPPPSAPPSLPPKPETTP
jgi:hypothetical protein